MVDIQDPTDDDSLEAALNALLQVAHDNDVDVEGGWKASTNGNGFSHWDVQIVRVKYAGDGAEDED